MSEKAQQLIDRYGDQACHAAVSLAVLATHIEDHEGARLFADAAIELMQAGYHKHPCKQTPEATPQSVSGF